MDSTTLVQRLRDTGLWPEDAAVQESILALSHELPDGKQLARELMVRGLLTAYQANQLLIGKGQDLVVGPYVLQERLGEGATGQVFKARHQKLRHTVALKLIRPERLINPMAVARFQREVQAALTFTHPHVVRALDAAQVGSTSYLAMQFVPGTNLARLVKERGPLPIPQACDFSRQTALGLGHIHEHGMVHRDIKPSNLAIAELSKDPGDQGDNALAPGQVKILDLGLARLCEVAVEGQPRQQALTQLGAIMGTVDYMAPEQGRDSRSVDARTDLYSLGCTLYFALTGKPPFPGGTHLEKLMHHQIDPPEPIENLRPDVPPALARIVRKLMAKNAADRYQTAPEVAAALLSFCHGEAAHAVTLAEPAPLAVAVLAPQAAPLAILVVAPEAHPVAAPHLNMEDNGEGQFVLGSSLAELRRAQQVRGRWFWALIIGALSAASLLLIVVLRLIFL